MPKNSNGFFVAWTTAPGRKEAEALALAGVEQRLAACGHVEGPIRSYYRWQGVLEIGKEYRVTFKVPGRNLARLEKWILEHHPYKTPQWVAVKAGRVLKAYQAWAERETRG